MTEKIKLLVIDDHAVVRTGISAWVASEPDLALVGEAADGEQGVARAFELKLDVILMDLIMPKKDGIEAIREIVRENAEARILMMTSFSEQARSVEAIRAGAMGFILKDTSPEEMLRAIRDVHMGKPWLSAEITRALMHAGRLDGEAAPESKQLTKREVEVLKLIAQGMSDADIESELTISKATVRFHVTNILAKLHLENRMQAALYAIRQRYVTV